MIAELKAGDKLAVIFWPNDGQLVSRARDPESIWGVEEIEVYMEPGQIAGVPWVCVTRLDGSKHRYNVAMLEGYQRLDEAKEEADV